MSKNIKIEKALKTNKDQKFIQNKVITQGFTSNIINAEETEIKFTQTSKTYCYKEQKIICHTKTQSRMVTIEGTGLGSLPKDL